jgi:hypothetical protein
VTTTVRAPRRAAKKPPQLPICQFTFDGKTCKQRGDHVCNPRVAHVLAFFSEVLVHTKGDYARRAFVLARWQRDEIIKPLMGTVRYDENRQRYVRRYRIAWIELARKNGKSELLAAIGLYLLAVDNEEGCEVYGCALDRDQARKVWDVAARMVQLSPALSSRLLVRKNPARIVMESTYSYYEVLSSDAGGNLGHNPHAILFDEIIAQRDHTLWDAMRTGMGARSQPLMIAATTAGDDPSSFAAQTHAVPVDVAPEVPMNVSLNFCHLCWRRWQPIRRPPALSQQCVPSRFVTPDGTAPVLARVYDTDPDSRPPARPREGGQLVEVGQDRPDVARVKRDPPDRDHRRLPPEVPRRAGRDRGGFGVHARPPRAGGHGFATQ